MAPVGHYLACYRRSARVPGLPALILLLLIPSACAVYPDLPQALPPVAAPVQSTERIPISIRTSWPALLAVAEGAIPRCKEGAADEACPETAPDTSFIVRREDEWTPVDRFLLGAQLGFKASVWRRDPIVATISGNHFSASLRLQYRARLGLVTGRQLASCGVNEPPREITVHLEGDLRFAPEWYVDPTLTVDLVAESRCTGTILNVDITNALVTPLRAELQREAEDMARRIRDRSNVREQVARVWAGLDQPVALARNVWFEFNLSDIAFRPPEITPDGRYVQGNRVKELSDKGVEC